MCQIVSLPSRHARIPHYTTTRPVYHFPSFPCSDSPPQGRHVLLNMCCIDYRLYHVCGHFVVQVQQYCEESGLEAVVSGALKICGYVECHFQARFFRWTVGGTFRASNENCMSCRGHKISGFWSNNSLTCTNSIKKLARVDDSGLLTALPTEWDVVEGWCDVCVRTCQVRPPESHFSVLSSLAFTEGEEMGESRHGTSQRRGLAVLISLSS